MFTLSACLQGIPSKTKAIHKPTLNLLMRVALVFNPDPDLCTNDLVGVSNFTIVPENDVSSGRDWPKGQL